ncbi:MAG: 16S rRNA (guanine(527)-N(7))-methyltransferase RsmG [Ruminococcus sp.]|nr:16S rRNA (guanine(527)-N(7))-methyltransferase RsmG [Ruminococcus sp.]
MLPEFEEAKRIFDAHGVPLDTVLYQKLDAYAEFLVAYNENVNLTAITDPREILIKHFLDSLLLIHKAEIPEGARMIDVGSGAGFPSVPVLLARPDIQLTLLDSLNKRIVFLQQLSERVGFRAEFLHSRAEDAAKQPAYREQFDVATARAVAAMPTLCEYCLPFVKVGGSFLALKGPGEEIADAAHAIDMLGGGNSETVDYSLCDEARKLFLVKKISHTPTKFPRNSGQIKNKTL